MSIFFIPSSDFGGNRRPSSDFAHPTHGRLGVLGTSGSDPRERGRAKSRAEREQAMEAFHAKRRKQAEERKTRETAAKTEREQVKARAAKAIVDRDRADREARNKAASARSSEMIREGRAKPAAERRVSPLDLLRQPVAAPSQTFEPTPTNVPSSYMNALDARAEARMPQAEYVPAAQSQARYDAQRAAEVPATRAAVSQEIAARKPKAPVAAPSAQDRNRNLISQAFAVPASGPVPSMQFSPEMQRARMSQEDRFAAGANPAVRYGLNEFVSEMGDVLTNGPFVGFNANPLTEEQRAAMDEARRTGRDFTSDIGDAIASGARAAGDFAERNLGDFIIDPRNNRFKTPAGLRPIQGPTMRAMPRNPLDALIEDTGMNDPRSMYYFPGKFY